MKRPAHSTGIPQKSSHRRRGSIIVVAMVALVVIAALATALLERASLHRRDVRRQDWVLQSEWLAQSALSRGASKAVADAQFREEVWQIPAEKFGGSFGGKATITVTADAADANRRKVVVVVADFPDHPSERVRTRRSVAVDVAREASE